MGFDTEAFGRGISDAGRLLAEAFMFKGKQAEDAKMRQAMYDQRRRDSLEDYVTKLQLKRQMGFGGRGGRGGSGGGRGKMPSPFDMAIIAAQGEMLDGNRGFLGEQAGNAVVDDFSSKFKGSIPLLSESLKKAPTNDQLNTQALQSVPDSTAIKYETAGAKFLKGDDTPLQTLILRDKFSNPKKTEYYLNKGMISLSDLDAALGKGVISEDEYDTLYQLLGGDGE